MFDFIMHFVVWYSNLLALLNIYPDVYRAFVQIDNFSTKNQGFFWVDYFE